MVPAPKSEVDKSMTACGAKPRRGWRRFLLKWTSRCVGGLVACCLTFCFFAWILGNTPVNRDFRNADHGVEILLVNNGVHVDLLVPLKAEGLDWSDTLSMKHFRQPDMNHTHCMLGWGNRQFYMETQTWDDLKILNVLFAFSGVGDTVVHAHLATDRGWSPNRTRRIRLSREQYAQLCTYLMATFRRRADGSVAVIPGAHYGPNDAFYEATGTYHLFRTCNVWVGNGLAQAGVRVGYWTVTPDLLFACLPEEPETVEIR
jgi:uncharacterized protein (TIGR02117 family)